MRYGGNGNDEPVLTAPRGARERAVERTGWTIGPPGPGMILGLLGAIALFVALLVPWRSGDVRADDVPLRFLVDADTGAQHPSLLLVLVPILAVGVIGSLIPVGGALRAVAGIGSLIVVGLFVFQVDDLVSGDGTIDVLDAGVYLAAIAGVLMVVSALVPSGWHTRRTVDRYVDVDQPADGRADRYVDAR